MKSTWINTEWADSVARLGTSEEVATLMSVYALSVPILRIIAGRKDLPSVARKMARKYVREYAANLEPEVA